MTHLTTCPSCSGELDTEVGCETCLGRGYVDLPYRPRLVPRHLPVFTDPGDDEPPLVAGGQGRSAQEVTDDAVGSMCLVAIAGVASFAFAIGAGLSWLVFGGGA
jgi:hypothetical protein